MTHAIHRTARPGRILVGTASWTDRSLLESGWYPEEASTPAARLAWYASRFPIVEVDSTYYHPPSLRTVQAWRDRTPAGFVFNVKAFSLLTGHPTRPEALYKDLRDTLGEVPERLYLDGVGPQIAEEVWRRFLGALTPLHEAGKLGALLFQFPPWLPAGEHGRRRVLDCARRCAPMRICVEFRNRTWMEGAGRAATLGFLAEHDIPYVCVDMPQGHPSSIPPVTAVTSDLAVVRLHGHSSRWVGGNVEERFSYRYTETELRRWASRILALSQSAETTHVLTNVCCGDTSQRTAARLAALIEESRQAGDAAPSFRAGVLTHPAARRRPR
ncbi:DUF72 domain-containing protein [Streptosporangium sp. NPDC000239]|uniref:DUF72 domain-containing protein n=1 Tax=Streptosporangium sp. NPDC000239 TaxID=3154248 RepID=UPI0033327756